MRVHTLKKAGPKEMIDVDILSDQAIQMYLALEELRKETKEAWQKLARPLSEVIKANNDLGIQIKKKETATSQQEDIMDSRVAANWVKVQELQVKVCLVFLDFLLGLLSAFL